MNKKVLAFSHLVEKRMNALARSSREAARVAEACVMEVVRSSSIPKALTGASPENIVASAQALLRKDSRLMLIGLPELTEDIKHIKWCAGVHLAALREAGKDQAANMLAKDIATYLCELPILANRHGLDHVAVMADLAPSLARRVHRAHRSEKRLAATLEERNIPMDQGLELDKHYAAITGEGALHMPDIASAVGTLIACKTLTHVLGKIARRMKTAPNPEGLGDDAFFIDSVELAVLPWDGKNTRRLINGSMSDDGPFMRIMASAMRTAKAGGEPHLDGLIDSRRAEAMRRLNDITLGMRIA